MKKYISAAVAVLLSLCLILSLSACKSKDKKSDKKDGNPSSSTTDSTPSVTDDTNSDNNGTDSNKKSADNKSSDTDSDSQSGTTDTKAAKKFLGNWKMTDISMSWAKNATKEQKDKIRQSLASEFGEGLSDKEYLQKYADTFDDMLDQSPVYIIKEGGKGEMITGLDGSATSVEVSWVIKNGKMITNGDTSFEVDGKKLTSSFDDEGLILTAVFEHTDKIPKVADTENQAAQ